MIPPTQAALIGCVLLLVLLASSIPVAFAMALVGGLGFWALTGSPNAALHMMGSELYGTFSKYDLSVIPLFVLMGQVAFHSGISRRLFRAAYAWLGELPGGLAMATIGACTGFGAICGSGPATAATMASVALPEMRRYKYDMELASGAVAAGGSLGMLIPPSVVFIVYGIMTEQSPGKLFIAGIIPGILIAILFCLTIYVNCIRRPELGPSGPATTPLEKLKALGGVWETALLFTIVIGGMFAGIFTPTEAAAVGAAGSLGVAAFRRKLTRKMLVRSLLETVRTSCMVMIIVAGAIMFGRFLTLTQLPTSMAGYLAALPVPGWMTMGLVIVFYLVAGCFVDALALILLTIPVFYPVVTALGYDPIWFGVIVVVVTQMGVISPPVGVNAYVVNGIERDISLQTVFKGALPFLGALVVSAALFMVFPQLCLFLPEQGRTGVLILAGGFVVLCLQAAALRGGLRLAGVRRPFGTAFVAAAATAFVAAPLANVIGRFPGPVLIVQIAVWAIVAQVALWRILRVPLWEGYPAIRPGLFRWRESKGGLALLAYYASLAAVALTLRHFFPGGLPGL